MAGTKIKDQFRELISPFLKFKMEELRNNFGEKSKEYLAIARQYIENPLEKNIEASLEKSRHYQSGIKAYYDNKPLKGLERLYKTTILLEPTTVCAAHCRSAGPNSAADVRLWRRRRVLFYRHASI